MQVSPTTERYEPPTLHFVIGPVAKAVTKVTEYTRNFANIGTKCAADVTSEIRHRTDGNSSLCRLVYFVNMGRSFLGEFEQRVLLAILRCDGNAYPIEIRREVARASGVEPSRGAFYTTLDRLEAKKLVRWTAEAGAAGRDGLPQRKFIVTAEGVNALRASRKALLELWNGLDEILSEA